MSKKAQKKRVLEGHKKIGSGWGTSFNNSIEKELE